MFRYLAILSVLFLLSCQQQGTDIRPLPQGTGEVIATVNDYSFYESDIDMQIHALPENLQHLGSDPNARAQILQVLLRRHILSQRAADSGLLEDPVVHERIVRARDDILIEALEDWQASRLPPPTESEINKYYKNHPAAFDIPEQIRVRHILVSSEKEARLILRKLRRKGDFAALAATHSLDDQNKSRGGDLNWFSRGMMVKEFEKAAFSLQKTGDISEPVKTDFGWHIIELLGKRPAGRKSIDEARSEIVNILQKEALSAWLDELLGSAKIEIKKAEYKLTEKGAPQKK